MLKFVNVSAVVVEEEVIVEVGGEEFLRVEEVLIGKGASWSKLEFGKVNTMNKVNPTYI